MSALRATTLCAFALLACAADAALAQSGSERFVPEEALLDQRPTAEAHVLFESGAVQRRGALIRSTAAGGVWSEPSTWAGGQVPTLADEVVIVSGATVEVREEGQRDCAQLTIEAGATLRGYIGALLGVREGGVDNQGVIEPSGEFSPGYVFILGTLGPFVNAGTIQTPEDSWAVEFEGYSDVENRGVWERSALELLGEMSRTILMGDTEAVTFFAGDLTPLVGDNTVGLYQVDNFLDVDWDASLTITRDENVGLFFYEWLGFAALRGEVRWAVESSFVSLHDATVEMATGATTIAMTSFGYRAPPAYGSAVTRHWRLDTSDPNARLASLSLRYASFDLLGNDPETMTIYHSADGGETWTNLLSAGEVFRSYFPPGDLGGEYGSGDVTIRGDLPASGDFVLSSLPQTATRPALYFRIDGRDQIRVGGPPQRHIVHYGNLGSTPLGYGLLRLDTEGGVYIESMVPSGSDDPENDRWDASIFSPEGDSTYALLRTPELAPGESRSFVITLRAVPVDPATRTAAPAVAGAVAFGIAISYLKDLMLSTGEEWLADPCGPLIGAGSAFDRGMQNTDAQYNPFRSEKPWQAGAENAAQAMFDDGVLARAAGPLGVANDMISAADAVTKGANRFEAANGPGSLYQPINCGPDQPPRPGASPPERAGGTWPLDPLRSWDPNAKVGPNGVGEQNFIAEGGLFSYQILFENKAEATAPAFRVVITDTLSDAFDLSTVKRVGESHPGFTLTQEGNVLRWEIEGIELPPNQNPPEGEGYVEFTIETLGGLPTGTRIENRATIVFDLNEPIVTNTHVNVIDVEPPTTVMTPLPPSVASDSVAVRFASDDTSVGSGVASVAVYASKDGGPFYRAGTTVGSALNVAVEPGLYQFYALSQDRVGNAERVRPDLVETVVAVSAEDDLPETFSLAPNFPNPFSNATHIAFSLPSAAPAELIVYDVLGREVARLVDGPMAAGRHKATWHTERVASGVYVYRLTQGERTASGRMVLVR
ncbi:MAG: T9SS type A sorting domain-containing protein [Bacteroidota bacterium]